MPPALLFVVSRYLAALADASDVLTPPLRRLSLPRRPRRMCASVTVAPGQSHAHLRINNINGCYALHSAGSD